MWGDFLDNNCEMWNHYLNEFTENASFSKKMIHLGLGLKGIDASEVVKEAKIILDVGCGDGINTTIMASEPYVKKVVGLDLSDEIIRNNKKKCIKNNMEFEMGDFLNNNLSSQFQLVIFIGSLDYIELSDLFFAKLNKLTEAGSRCFIAKFHPYWTSLFKNDDDDLSIKNYFSTRTDEIRYGAKKQFKFVRYHYSICEIINRFEKSGWNMKMLDEPEPCIADSSFKYVNYDKDETLMEKMRKIPMTLVMEFERK